MSVALQIGRSAPPTRLQAPPSAAHLLALAALWMVALWPTRAPGLAWIEAGLGAFTLLAGHEILRRGLLDAFVRLELTQDVLSAAAVTCGVTSSILLLALDATGGLPTLAMDPRGGPRLFFAEVATVLALRFYVPTLASLGIASPGVDQEAMPPTASTPRLPRLLLIVVATASVFSLTVAITLALTGNRLPGLVSTLIAILGCTSLEALAMTRLAPFPQALLIKVTGILTTGRPEVLEALPRQEGDRPGDVLYLAALAEYPIEHPIRDAIFRKCQGRFPTVARLPGVERREGRGVRAKYHQRELLCGNLRLFREAGWSQRALDSLAIEVREHGQAGDSVIFVACGQELHGILRLRDPLRADAASALQALRRLGLEIHVTSGDHQASVEGLLRDLGPVIIHAGITPAERDQLPAQLQASGRSVEVHADAAGPGGAPPTLRSLVFGLRKRHRRRTLKSWFAGVAATYFASVILLFTGALEPWLALPPLPALAALMAALAPFCLSFVFDRVEIYNRAFFRAQHRRGKRAQAASRRSQPPPVPCKNPSTISSS